MTDPFKFTVFTKRWNREDTYTLSIHEEGWNVSHMTTGGVSDRRGAPGLYNSLGQDSIEYPSGLGYEMEILFEHARDKTLSHEEIQRRLDRLAKWVNEVDNVDKPSFDE